MSITYLSDTDRQMINGVWEALGETNRLLTNLLEAMQPPPVRMAVIVPPDEATIERRRRERDCLKCGLGQWGRTGKIYCNDGGVEHVWPDEKVKTIYDDPDEFKRKEGRCMKCGIAPRLEYRDTRCGASTDKHDWPVTTPATDSYIMDARVVEGRCLNCGAPDRPENRSSNRCNIFGGGHSWPEETPDFDLFPGCRNH